VFSFGPARRRAPSAVVVTTGTAQVRLNWTPVATAASYIVKRVEPSGGATIIASGVTTTSFVDWRDQRANLSLCRR
jgi:hypothetical protein